MVNAKMLELGSKRSTIRELFEFGKALAEKIGADKVFDFSIGNPSIPAPDAVSDILQSIISTTPSIELHGYTSAAGDPSVRRAIADYISSEYGAQASPDLVYMTVGAAAALTCTLRALISDGDEVVLLAPYFPEYKVFAEAAGAKTITAICSGDTFRPDLNALEAAIGERCAAVIINSPNNPSGAVYPEEDIIAIANLLEKKSRELGHPIAIIADEPYRELVYGATVPYIPNYYADTVVCYSFSKSISIPGERIGYVFVSPRMHNASQVFAAVAGAGRAQGYVCAPSLQQRLAARCLGMTSDISAYRENRDILVKALRGFGSTVPDADGAFYLFMKSPCPDAVRFSDFAKQRGLLLVPGDDFGYPGYLRIAY